MFKPLAHILIILATLTVAAAQSADTKKDGAANTPKADGMEQPLRSVPFPAGVNLVFLIKELARDLDLNALFDPESRLDTRRTTIELRNVTGAEALNYLLLQEGLIAENVGPRTILVANQLRGRSVPQIGIGLTPLTEQLSKFFGAEGGGALINNVQADSPAAKAGLKAGDVITEVDGTPVRSGVIIYEAAKKNNEGGLKLKIIRDRKPQTVIVTTQKMIE